MDNLAAARITIDNLLVQCVQQHNQIVTKLEQLNKEAKALPDIGQDFDTLIETYKELKRLSMVYDYLVSQDVFSVMNDFKKSKAVVIKALKEQSITLKR